MKNLPDLEALRTQLKPAPRLPAEQAQHLKEVVSLVMATFKRREIYRHLSNAGDRLARAGEVLHDIVVKIS